MNNSTSLFWSPNQKENWCPGLHIRVMSCNDKVVNCAFSLLHYSPNWHVKRYRIQATQLVHEQAKGNETDLLYSVFTVKGMQVQDLRQIHPVEADHPLVEPFSHSAYKSSTRTAAWFINQGRCFLTFSTTLAKITKEKKAQDKRAVLFLRLTPRRAAPFICSPRPELCRGRRSDSKPLKRTAGVSQMLPGSNNVLIQAARRHAHGRTCATFTTQATVSDLKGQGSKSRDCCVSGHQRRPGMYFGPHGLCYLRYSDLSSEKGSFRTKKKHKTRMESNK